MTDWSVGDLAVSLGRVGDGPVAKGGPRKGTILRVCGVVDHPKWAVLGLIFDAFPSPHSTRAWSHKCFRKIRPDEHEACEPEFVTLLKRTKQPATTNYRKGVGA